jgi:translation initiation factor IF-1
MTNKGAVTAEVIESLPNQTYRLRLGDDRVVIGFLSGKMKMYKVKIVVGDVVEVIVDPYGGTATNRIVYRKTPR